MPSEYDALLAPSPTQTKSEYDALLPTQQKSEYDQLLEPQQPQAQSTKGFGAFMRGLNLSAIPGDVLRTLVPFTEAPRAIKQAIDVVSGVPIAQAIPESQQLVGIEKKPLEERITAGLNVATQLAFLAAGGRALPLKEIAFGKPTAEGSLRETAFGKPETPIPVTEQAAAEVRPKEVTTDASKITGAKSVPVPEVRQEVGGEAPLRQQGQTAEARQEIAPQEVAPVPQPEPPVSVEGQTPAVAGQPKIISTAINTPEGIKRGTKWNQPHDEIGAARVETARPSPTQETGKVAPEYEHLKKGIANWYDPNAPINAFGKVNDDGSISIPLQRFGVASTDATRGGTWYELNRGGVSDYNALPETGAAKIVGNVATKYGVGGKERVESEITTKNPFLVNATRLHEGQYPLELAKKVLSEEEFRKAKRGITGANAEKAYSRLEKLTSQKLQEQGHDAVIFYHKYEYGSIPHQIFKLPAEAGAGTKIAVTTEPIVGAGVPRESVAASAKPASVPEGGTRAIGGAAAPQIPEEQKGFIIQNPDGTTREVWGTEGRKEAAVIAKAAGQVKPENAGTTALHSQQLQETPTAKAPPAAMTPEPPQTPEELGAALSEKPRLAGPSNRVLQERAARGEIPQAPESGIGVLKEDLISKANAQYSPERVQTAAQNIRRGASTLDDEAVAVLHEEKLTKAASDAERALKASPNDLALQQAYQSARNAMTDWQHGTIQPMKTLWSNKGINLQGATDVDTGTLVGLQKLAWDTAKRDFTAKELPIMNEAADRVRVAEAEEKASIVKANDAVQKVLKPSRYMDLKQLQESLAETLKTMTC